MPEIVETEYEITEKDPNITLNDVSKDIEGIAWELKVPRKTAFLLRPSDTLSFYGKDNGTTPTEIPTSNLEKIRHTDPNEIVRLDMRVMPYEATKDFRDRDLIFRLGFSRLFKEDQKLQFLIKPEALSTGATKIDKTTYRVRLTVRRIFEVIKL